MAEFDPRQLDILEDALENIDKLDDLASLELSPALSERLAEYQDVLALCRETFPLEMPRDDLLAEVIAEAHEVSRRPKLLDGLEGEGSSWRRFWERWRGTVLPGVALAGTAAAVLFMLEPDMMQEDKQDLLTDTSKERRAERPEDSKRSQPASEPTFESKGAKDAERPDKTPNAGGGTPNAGDNTQDGAPLGEAQPDPDPAVDSQPDPPPRKSSATAHKPGKSPTPAVVPSQELAQELAPELAPEPMSKDDTWTSLDRGNAARRTGNCDRARSIYDEVIAAGSDSLAVARAKAGIGLCLEQDRRTSEATSWFDDARSANPGIDAWINTQRDEQPMPGEKKHSKKSDVFEADAL